MRDPIPSTAADIIRQLQLVPHPEGGWYRETFRKEAATGARSAFTLIHFLLEQGQGSHWHRVDADEIWFWHAGSALTLAVAADGHSAAEAWTMGPDVLAGERPHMLVPAHHWQAAHAARGWALVSCMVAPGFEFGGFELAPEGWEPGAAGGG